jgi:hypothetical protein
MESLQKFWADEAVEITIEVNMAFRLCQPLHDLIHEASPLPVNNGKAIECFTRSQNQAAPQCYAAGVHEDQESQVSVQATTNRPICLARIHPCVAAVCVSVQSAPEKSFQIFRNLGPLKDAD